jgi:pimeloyl-ACP methyl ester carboxylesterase
LPNASLHIIPGGEHMFAGERSDEVARLVAGHLG